MIRHYEKLRLNGLRSGFRGSGPPLRQSPHDDDVARLPRACGVDGAGA